MGRTVKMDVYKEALNIPKDLLWQRRFYDRRLRTGRLTEVPRVLSRIRHVYLTEDSF